MPDPKLKIAMEEIKAVLEKHDLGAVVWLVSPGHMEFLNKFSASWSCITHDGRALRIKALKDDFPDQAAQKLCLENTVGMLAGLSDGLETNRENIQQILRLLGGHFEIEHITQRERESSDHE